METEEGQEVYEGRDHRGTERRGHMGSVEEVSQDKRQQKWQDVCPVDREPEGIPSTINKVESS